MDNVADNIGLLPGFGIAVGTTLAGTIIWFLIWQFGIPLALGFTEGRVLPLLGEKQFDTYFPGSIVLSISTGGYLWLGQYVNPDEYDPAWGLHVAVLIVLTVLAAVISVFRSKSGCYTLSHASLPKASSPRGSLRSPLSIYNKWCVFVIGGYYSIVSFAALVISGVWHERLGWFIIFALCWIWWLGCFLKDNFLDQDRHAYRASQAYRIDCDGMLRDRKMSQMFGDDDADYTPAQLADIAARQAAAPPPSPPPTGTP